MNILNHLLTLSFCLLFPDASPPFFQEYEECGTDQLMEQIWQEEPAIFGRHNRLESAYQTYIQRRDQQPEGAADYTLPVVVHIVHQNGFENISDGEVERAIEWLNDGFANINYYDQNVGVDTRIQFCLAQRDPDGNATNGILHIESPHTNVTSDIALKNTSRWDPYSYINIWVVNNAGGPGGYATLPSAHGKSADGVVVQVDKMLDIGSAHSTLIHELGHYLGLYHVFTGGCKNDDCLVDGDRVCDTPPDGSTAAPLSCRVPVNSCDTDTNSGLNTDMDDLTWNYLDYGNYKCRSGYTQGQADRMHFYIENARSSLLNNLTCVDPCPTPFIAAFTSSSNEILMGEQVQFVNTSTGGNDYRWFVNDNLEATSQDFNYIFDSGSGSFEVKLEANIGDPNCQEIFKDTIEVLCPAVADFSVSSYRTIINEPVTFTNASVNAQTYSWRIDGQQVSTNPSLTHRFASEGRYTVQLEVFDATLKCSDLKTVYIDVKCVAAIFTMSDTFPVPGSTVTFQDHSLGANFLEWTVDGQVVSNDPNYSHLFNASGIYTICLKVSNASCMDEWCTKLFVFDSLSTECENTFISILGNNGSDEGQCLTLLDNQQIFMASSQNNDIGLTLLDQTGQLLWNRVFNPYPEREHVKDIHYEGNGIVIAVGETDRNNFSEAIPFAFKYDVRNDQLVWFRDLRFLGIEHCDFYDINVHPQSGNYLITGQIHGGPATGCDALLMEIDQQSGQQLWARFYTLGSCETFLETQVFQNKLYLVGRFNNAGGGTREMRMTITELELNGDHNWSRLYIQPVSTAARMYASSFHIDQQSILVSGHGDLNGISASDVELLLYQTDLQGNINWCNVYNIIGAQNERLTRIFEVTDGYLLAGNYISNNGNTHIFLIHVDEQGEILSTKAFGQNGFNTSLLSLEFFDGKMHLIGRTDHFNGTDNDIIILKLNALGEVVDQECTLEMELDVDQNRFNNPYDGFHNIRVSNLNASFDPRMFNLTDLDINKEDLCYEPCLYDTCFNGAYRDSVPDVWLTELKTFCNGTGITMSVEICNTNKKSVPDSLPIAIYGRDPVNETGHFPVFIFYTTERIDGGECKTFYFDFTAHALDEIYVIANDKGFVPTALDLERFEPNTLILECNYVNNIGHTYLPFTNKELNLGPDEILCPDFVKELDAGAGFSTYAWSTLETDQRITVYRPGTYWVEAIDSCGKVYHDTIVLSINQDEKLDIGMDSLVICSKETIRISVPGFSDYKWHPRAGMSCDTCPEFMIQSDTNLMIWLTARSDLGCLLRDSLWVTIAPLDSLFEAVDICEGDSINYGGIWVKDSGVMFIPLTNPMGCDTILKLTVELSEDTTWQRFLDTICPGEIIQIEGVEIDSPGVYQFENEEGTCTEITEWTIRQTEIPVYELTAMDISCFGERDGSISLTQLTEGFSYQLFDAVGELVTEPTQLEAGIYTIQIMDEKHGCLYRDSAIIKEPDPVLIQLPPDTLIECGEGLFISAYRQPDSLNVSWSPKELIDCDGCPRVMIKPEESQWIYAETEDENGCRSRDSMWVEVTVPVDIFIPNVFTPNGDNHNDLWRIFTNKNVTVLRTQIFDRWGELVHDSDITGKIEWDGIFNGKNAPNGVYAYLVKYQIRNIGEEVQTGDVTIMR